MLIILAFAAFTNEMVDFFLQLVGCIGPSHDMTLKGISVCISTRFRDWWTGSEGLGLQTVISHWIDVTDWSLQLGLFFYVVAPAAATLWAQSADRSGAGLGF